MARRRDPGLDAVTGFRAGGFRREDFTEENLAIIAAEAARVGAFTALGRDAREASRRGLLARHAPGAAVWVFGYGSLMWNPAFHCAARRPGLVYGYHRRFCLWMTMGRGTPDIPGLMLGLERGGSCRGVALKIAPHHVESETTILWRREMMTGTYQPRWVSVHTEDGPLAAIAFVANHGHPRYSGRLDLDTMVRAIALARGRLGHCRDYLRQTVRHLDELGIGDGPMHRLLRRVEAYGSADTDAPQRPRGGLRD